jgi:hypothetical protein
VGDGRRTVDDIESNVRQQHLGFLVWSQFVGAGGIDGGIDASFQELHVRYLLQKGVGPLHRDDAISFVLAQTVPQGFRRAEWQFGPAG